MSDQPPAITIQYSANSVRHLFNKESKLADSAKFCGGTKFRPNMTLVMEDDTFIGSNDVILVPKLTMKKGSQINANATLTGREPITLGENVVVSYGCTLITSSDTPMGHRMNDASPEKQRHIRTGPIQIHNNCFIGANSIIMPQVDIAEGIVVRAGSYVDMFLVFPYHIYSGNKSLKERNFDSKIRHS